MSVSIAALRWPLVVGPTGTFVSATTLEQGWSDRVRAIISTRIGERVMRNTYGCEIGDALFSPLTESEAERMIRKALSEWAPPIEVIDISVVQNKAVFDVTVDYRLPGGTNESVYTTFRTPVGGLE